METPAWLNQLLEKDCITDICFNGSGELFIDEGNGLIRSNLSQGIFNLHLWTIHRLSDQGLSFDAKNPFIDFSLPSGHRVHALFPPCHSHLLVSIRTRAKASARQSRWTDSKKYWSVLETAIQQGESILIAGATGSGKTTLSSDLISCVNPLERIIALEDVNELRPAHPHFVSLLSRKQNADGFGEITLRTLLTQSLRMRPDRIVLGECRGPEVLDLLQILNTGHRGAIATVHAHSARDAISRLELLCQLTPGAPPLDWCDKKSDCKRIKVDRSCKARRINS